MFKPKIHGARALCGVIACHCAAASLSAETRLVAGPAAWTPSFYTQSPPLPIAYTNNHGVSTGSAANQSSAYAASAARWSESGSESLAPLGEWASGWNVVGGISESGVVLGGWQTTREVSVVRWGAATGAPATSILPATGTTDRWSYATFAGVNRDGDFAASVNKAGLNNEARGRFGISWVAGSNTPIAFADVEVTTERSSLVPNALNDQGMAVGWRNDVVKTGRAAVRWQASGAAARLDDLSPDASESKRSSEARDVNNSGVAVGGSSLVVNGVSQFNRAVKWDAGGSAITLLAAVPPPTSSTMFVASSASHINDAGTIVGSATPLDPAHGYLDNYLVRWTANGTVATPLQSLGVNTQGARVDTARDLNNGGTVLGLSTVTRAGKAIEVPVLWLANSTAPIELTTLLGPADAGQWTMLGATDVSDTGWIAGWADYLAPGATVATPRYVTLLVPEAGTYGMGDANFDAKIDFNDLVVLAQHYSEPNAGKATNVGDFNLDGGINFLDLVALAQNYGYGTTTMTAASFAADWAMVQAVPEPATLTLLTSAFLSGRRRRRSQL